MVDAAPFRGVRYDPQVAGDAETTSAPAYDDIERFAYARHRTASPYTVLELLAARGARGYADAGGTLDRWWRTRVLVADPEPAFYRYEEHELRDGVPAVQRGLMVALRLEPLDGRGAVLAHEEVDPTRVEERLERLEAAPLDVSPVFAMYRDGPTELRDLLDRPPLSRPLVAASDETGTDHRIWRVGDAGDIALVRAALSTLRVVIADGHHRYATALAHAHRLGDAADSTAHRTLAYLVDAQVHGPRLEPVHRLLRSAPADLLDRLAADFTIEPGPADPRTLELRLRASRRCVFGLRLAEGRGYLLRPRDEDALRGRLPGDRSPAWRAVDAVILAAAVLGPLGVDPSAVEPRTDAAAAAAAVDGGQASALILVRPTTAAVVHEVAERGEPLPAKTTSFHPKPRTGLLMRAVGDPTYVRPVRDEPGAGRGSA
ncbi:MAG: DUF1015 domain-containing protein [Euzebyales bacterium]|nr:DUF1015 domain-containing protein [Euzebyales bacterium]